MIFLETFLSLSHLFVKVNFLPLILNDISRLFCWEDLIPVQIPHPSRQGQQSNASGLASGGNIEALNYLVHNPQNCVEILQ